MNELEISKKILLKLVEEDAPFALVLRNACKKYNVEPQAKSNITALLGCELRHHYIFDNLIFRFFEVVEFEKTIFLRFALANHLFLKRFSEKDLLDLVYAELDSENVKKLFEFVDSTDAIIPSELDKASPEFLSLRYNTPAWVIRMWQKQYGKGAIFKTLKVNYRPSVPSLRVNEYKVNIDDFLGKHPDFSVAPIDNMIIYQGRGNVKGLPEYQSNEIFYMKMATKMVLDSLELDLLKGIAIYSEVANNIYLDLYARFSSDVRADIIINHGASYFETKKMIATLPEHHFFIYESPYTGLLTCLSHNVHTFICMPKSTALDLLRSTPDYFLRVKQDQLDEIIKGELASLEECAKFVEVGGELVYMIPTLNRKESNNVIANFLVKHKEYKLVEERQFFPFEVYDSCLYYARLAKVEESSD